jgi:hypothetical protein
MSGTIYARLMDARLERPLAETTRLIEAFFSASDLARCIEDLLKQAYVAGVTDGFAQGIAASEEQA